MRGEYQPIAASLLISSGSSPHAWGIPRQAIDSLQQQRFIPTCVGNTRCLFDLFLQFSVHPHMRGEYILALSA